MYCTNCGKKMPDNAEFCTECGREMEYYFPEIPGVTPPSVSQLSQPAPQKKKKKAGVIIAVAAAAVVLLGGAAALFSFAADQLGDFMYSLWKDMDFGGTNQTTGPSQIQEAVRYDQALSLQEERKYTDALLMFRELGDYRDSREKAAECAYSLAEQYLDSGNFTTALSYMNLMNQTQKDSIFDRYYAEFCADTRAKGDLYGAIKTYYYNFLLSQDDAQTRLDQLQAEVDRLLLPYESSHFDDAQLKTLLLNYRERIADLMPAAMTGDIITYLEAMLQLHRTIDLIQLHYVLLEDSQMRQVMSAACVNLESAIAQYAAFDIVRESLEVDFSGQLPDIGQLPFDSTENSYYLDYFNNTVYTYTLTYQVVYYDRSGNVIETSENLTQRIVGADYTRVLIPCSRSNDVADYDVIYQLDITSVNLQESYRYAVRMVDAQGKPIEDAHVTFRGEGNSDIVHHTYITDRNGIARARQNSKGETFRVWINRNPNFISADKEYVFPDDGRVHEMVVLPAAPDFSVTVVDTNGYPIPGVTMHLATTDVFTASKYGKTDENGYVCWYDVDMSHTYKISGISFLGYVYIDQVRFEPGEHHITVVMEREEPENEIPSYTVTVVDTQGNPIAGVVLYITTSDVFSGQYYQVTDQNGNACWYDVDMEYSYKVVRIRKEGYICPEEVHFEPGENHLIIVLEEESET